NDRIELTDEIMPHMHVYEAFHAESELIPVTRLNGVTNAIVAPDSTDTLPGQDSFVQLAGPSAAEMLWCATLPCPSTSPASSAGMNRGRSASFRRRAWAWLRNFVR